MLSRSENHWSGLAFGHAVAAVEPSLEIPSHRSLSVRHFLGGLFQRGNADPNRMRATVPEPQNEEPRQLLHDLNNVLGVVIGSFDEQLEILDASDDVAHRDLRKLAQDGLAAALRGAGLIRQVQAAARSAQSVQAKSRTVHPG